MKLRSFIFTLLIISSGFLPLHSYAAPAPLEQVKETVDAVVLVLRDSSKDVETKKTEIRSLISQRFDYKAMSQRTLATNWKKASAEEKAKFIQLYGKLLEDTYLVMVEEYTNETVAYKDATIRKDKYAEVDTSIVMSDKEIPVKYKTYLKQGNWYIYDVVIEGVSLISNYRSSYQAIAKKEGVSGLITKLEAKLNGSSNP